MEKAEPSRTAWSAAVHRAAHQILEGGRIFRDPLAVRILGAGADQQMTEEENRPGRRSMRIFIAVRARFAEDALSADVGRGVSQVVILGAGLDTFAYRQPYGDRIHVFEADHPATQAWKRERLRDTGITVPSNVTFAAIDLEREPLRDGLTAAGFQSNERSFFIWLGVVPYLSEASTWSTLQAIGSLEGGASVVFDYANPPHSFNPALRAIHERRAARVAELGEPWVNYFETAVLVEGLGRAGFVRVEDLGPRAIAGRYFPHRLASLSGDAGGHVVLASTF